MICGLVSSIWWGISWRRHEVAGRGITHEDLHDAGLTSLLGRMGVPSALL